MGKYLFYAASFDNVFNICELDTETEKLSHIRRIEYDRPAQLILSKNKLRLYVASEMVGAPGGAASFDISNPYNPVLMSRILPGTQGPCYVALTIDEKFLVGTSYFEGNVEVFPVLSDGSLGERCFEHRFTGTGTAYLPGSGGQAVPRAHCVMPLPGTNFLLVTDYSGDRVVCFTIDTKGVLTEVSSVSFAKGDAPRLLAAQPNRNDIIYMVTEYTSLVYVIKVDCESGKLTTISDIHSLAGEKASFSSALRLSHDGKFIYVSNRHNKNISVLSLHDYYERLEYVGALPCAGFVRDVEFAPSADYMVVGDQDTNNILLYKVNRENGMCARLASSVYAETPAYFAFLNS
jgi:6-phosphogluconolactonase